MNEKLLYIFYQDQPDAPIIHEYIESVERLDELVAIQQADVIMNGVSNAIYIHENRIHIPPEWLDNRPAIVFPSEIPFNKNYFLGVVFGMLGNEEKYPAYFTGYPALLYIFDLIRAITKGEEADQALENILGRTKFAHPFENYAFNHNVAVALNYGHYSNEINAEAIDAHYKDALQLAFEPSYKALTLKYYAAFLVDNGESLAAAQLLDQQHFKMLDDYPAWSLKKAWCQAAMKQLKLRNDHNFLVKLKHVLWETIQFFDQHQHKTIAAFLWMDAATLANFSNSYAESLGYITKAINYFKEEKQNEIEAQAQLLRGRLFYDWAQAGNPQFYRSALEAYQEALKVFKKEEAPEIFAEIHQQLGVIYAELPDESKKRSIWAALSATSFNEALAYYDKLNHPYEFGMICNNYGNAYAKYPVGGRTDNFEKALNFYTESLSVRNAQEYPAERAVTLLNYLEASWKVSNPDTGFNMDRYQDMAEKVKEIKTLTQDEQLLLEMEKHLDLLKKLEAQFSEELIK